MKSPTRREHRVTSSRRGLLEFESNEEPVPSSPRRNATKVPIVLLEAFVVPPMGTPYVEGSFNCSGSFSWITNLSLMLEEIWFGQSFQELSKDPLQADNQEGIQILSR